MTSILDSPADKAIRAIANELKKNAEIKPPEWVFQVKSGAHAERPPEEEDFWYIRCASLLRSVYLNPGIGVERLRHKYGGSRKHKVSRSHHTKAGGKIIRTAFQQLEKAGLVRKEKFGRFLTDEGRLLLEKASTAS
ncbi:30S ribosomal protein S19e [Candidatus Micrarchaeota archaeon]|nr:30S ribosomal protein S19e [Candidatus Micrarchaeota archaeon]